MLNFEDDELFGNYVFLLYLGELHNGLSLSEQLSNGTMARFFLLVDLRDFFRFRVGGTGKKKKGFENDQLSGHFQSFFFIFRFLLISPEKNS